MIFAVSFIFGLMIGSFLNVCASRLPRDLSIIRPASRCPQCLEPIKFYDNIPVISFLLLRGRCRKCSSPISLKYPAVEILTALLTAFFVSKWHAMPLWLAVALPAVYILTVMALIDLETMMISDAFPLALVTLALAGSFVNPYFSGAAFDRLKYFLAGGAFGGGLIWVMAVIGKKMYKKDAIGDGDILLMAAIGALTGWQGALTTLVMASFFGSLYGITLLALKRADRLSSIPFGPFLAMGTIINLYSLVKPAYFLFF